MRRIRYLLALVLLLIGDRAYGATYFPFARSEGDHLPAAVVSSLRGVAGITRITSGEYAAAFNLSSGTNYSALEWARFFEQGNVVTCSDAILARGIKRLDRSGIVSEWIRPCKADEELLVAIDDTGREVGYVSLFCLNPIVYDPVPLASKTCRTIPTPAPSTGAACGVGGGTYFFGNYSDACGMAGVSPTTTLTVCD